MFAELHIERGRLRAVLPCAHGSVIKTEHETYSYPGCSVVPGFVDSHVHVVGLGERLVLPSLHAVKSLREAVGVLQQSSPNRGEWIVAMGWNQEQWAGGELPTLDALDAALPTTPVYATRVDGHAAWVNSEALRRANLDPRGHSGILVDDEMLPVSRLVPHASDEDIQAYILAAGRYCAAQGITEVHDMDVAPAWLENFRLLAEAGTLPVRVNSYVRAQKNDWLVAGVLPYGGELHRVVGIKLFADGALGSRGARLTEPYSDQPQELGLALLAYNDLLLRCREAIDHGWRSIAVHAIGDAAVETVMEVFAELRKEHSPDDVGLRIEHVQICSESVAARIAAESVVASVQPLHYASDLPMALRRLGNSRMPNAYRWNSLLQEGALLIAGSDAPVEPPSVRRGIYEFCSRDLPDGSGPSPERIRREQAIAAFTQWPHKAVDTAHRRGALRVGMDADIVVIDRDIETCPLTDIVDARIMATFSAGRRRYAV